MRFTEVNKIASENGFNKLLRGHKRNGGNLFILITSPWDKVCNSILDAVKLDVNSNEVLNVVDLFSMPHVSVVFNTTKTPHLITFTKDGLMTDDYVSRVLGFFEM